MKKLSLKKLEARAEELALANDWGTAAYTINMAILKVDHSNCPACTRLAKYYKLQNRMDEAENMYRKALSIDPTSRGAINNLRDIEYDKKKNN